MIIKKKNITSAAILLSLFLILSGCAERGGDNDTESASESIMVTESNEQIQTEEGSVDMGSDIIEIKITEISDNAYKSEKEGNPILSNWYVADPTSVEYNGRVYVYGTNDNQQLEKTGDTMHNGYEHIKSLVVCSTADMQNWTFEGIINVEAVAPWIISSWAPSIVSRVEDDGLTHFYLYFANNGCGTGVLTSTDPVTGWTDPLGKPMISYDTPGINNCPNPFDPGAVIDENGVGWLTFGGGRTGTAYQPGTARIVQLADDMISFGSEVVTIDAPYFNEAGELDYINGYYIYTYNTNWDERTEWDIDGYTKPTGCCMCYMVTKTPLVRESWEYRGEYFPNPGTVGMNYTNNHTHIQKFKGQYYLFYHAIMLNEPTVYRSICADELWVDESVPEYKTLKANKKGVSAVGKSFDPYSEINGTSCFTSSGMGYEKIGQYGKKGGDLIKMTAVSAENGAWQYLKNVNFKNGAESFSADVKGKGTLEIRIDDINSEPFISLSFDSGDYTTVRSDIVKTISGKHDVYIIFSSAEISVLSWSFSEK